MDTSMAACPSSSSSRTCYRRNLRSSFATGSAALLVVVTGCNLLDSSVFAGLSLWRRCHSERGLLLVRRGRHHSLASRLLQTPVPTLPSAKPLLPMALRQERVERLQKNVEELHFWNEKEEMVKRKWMNRRKEWTKMMEEESKKGKSVADKLIALSEQVMEWLPEAISVKGTWEKQLDVEDLTEVFSAFKPEIASDIRPCIQIAFRKTLPHSDLQSMSIITEGMAKAGVPEPEVWKALGEYASRRFVKASREEALDFAWALAAAATSDIGQPSVDALKAGLNMNFGQVSDEIHKVLAWGCGEAGAQMTEVFGLPPFVVEDSEAHQVWSACSSIASSNRGTELSRWPVHVVSIKAALSQEHATSLIKLVDDHNIWLPSARGPSGTPLDGYPWSALLSSERFKSFPAVLAVRNFAAELFGVDVEHVEAVRILRYREGEASSGAHADARPLQDPSLWLSGQRLATVMIQLSDVQEGQGGDVVFPKLGQPGDGGLRIPPPPLGTAVAWPTVNVEGLPEPRTARMQMPLTGKDSVQYKALTWIRTGPVAGEVGGPPI